MRAIKFLESTVKDPNEVLKIIRLSVRAQSHRVEFVVYLNVFTSMAFRLEGFGAISHDVVTANRQKLNFFLARRAETRQWM